MRSIEGIMDGWSVTQQLAAGRLSEGLYEMMLDSENAAIVLDAEERIVAVNEKWQNLCGFTPSEALHASPKILQGELTNKEKAYAFAEDLRTTGEARTTLANYTKDGEVFAHRLHALRYADNRTGDVFYVAEGVEETDPAVRRTILKLPGKRTAMHELMFGWGLLSLLLMTLGVSAAAASFTARGFDIKEHATIGVIAMASIGLAVLSRASSRILLLASTLAAILALATTLPTLLLLPSAIPLAVLIISATLVATEPRLPARKDLHALRRTRLRRADFVAQAMTPGANNLTALEKEVVRRRPAAHTGWVAVVLSPRPTPLPCQRVARAEAWLDKDQRKHSGIPHLSPSPRIHKMPDGACQLPSPTAPSQLSYWGTLATYEKKTTERETEGRSHSWPRTSVLGFGLVMLLLGIISVTYQADTHTALRKSINMREATETARQAAADNLGPSSDWIRESLTHSMLI